MSSRRIAVLVIFFAAVLSSGCAGPSKLAQKSEENLAAGELTHAWQLATRALDKDPGNARARQAATAAGNAIARDWEQRNHVLAQSDSVAAAEQVLQLADFRVGAIRYAAITVSPDVQHEEQALRQSAAHLSYRHGQDDLASKRPKSAYLHFADALRFVPDYRNAAQLADQAHNRAATPVAVVPFAVSTGDAELGRQVASDWRDRIAEHLADPDVHFTTVLGSPSIEQNMTVAQLGRANRDDALALGRKAGAARVVWARIDGIDSQTKLHLFVDVISHRVTEKDANGNEVTRWVEVPVEIVSRVRTVTANVDYEVIGTRGGETLAHQRSQRVSSARVVWTSFQPEGDLGAYALVSEAVRAANPTRAKDIETRWKDACGDNTTLQQVLEARRSTHNEGHYDREALPRLVAGTAFLFLQELPPTQDLAYAALANGWQPVVADLIRLDAVDDVDLGVAAVRNDPR